MLQKEKRDDSVKWQAYADVGNQIPGPSKEDTPSPTVSLEMLLITSVIKSYKGRELEIVDVPRDFLMAEQYEVINMTLRGKLAELMVKTAP